MALYGAKAIPFGTLATGSRSFTVTGTMRLLGFSFTETTGSGTAEVDIYDGEGSGGSLIAAVTLASNESAREFWSPYGVTIEHGVGLVWVSGSVKGSVFVIYPYMVDPDDTGVG